MTENNNEQFIITFKLFNEIKSLSDHFKHIFIDQELPLRKHRLRLLTFNFQNIINTIILAKIDTSILFYIINNKIQIY